MTVSFIIAAGGLLAISMLLTIQHLLPGSGYLYGNAEKFAVLLEVLILGTTLWSGGGIVALLVNGIAGLFMTGLLFLGRHIFGGARINWSYKELFTSSLGFSKETIEPSIHSKNIGEKAKDLAKRAGSFIKECNLSPSHSLKQQRHG